MFPFNEFLCPAPEKYIQSMMLWYQYNRALTEMYVNSLTWILTKK